MHRFSYCPMWGMGCSGTIRLVSMSGCTRFAGVCRSTLESRATFFLEIGYRCGQTVADDYSNDPVNERNGDVSTATALGPLRASLRGSRSHESRSFFCLTMAFDWAV